MLQWVSIWLKHSSRTVVVACETWNHSHEERYFCSQVNILPTACHIQCLIWNIFEKLHVFHIRLYLSPGEASMCFLSGLTNCPRFANLWYGDSTTRARACQLAAQRCLPNPWFIPAPGACLLVPCADVVVTWLSPILQGRESEAIPWSGRSARRREAKMIFKWYLCCSKRLQVRQWLKMTGPVRSFVWTYHFNEFLIILEWKPKIGRT